MGVIVREKEKSSGEWWIFINHKGKRASKLIGSRKAAKETAGKIEKEIALERFNLDTPVGLRPITFRQYAEKWLAGHVRTNLKESSCVGYKRLLVNHIYPAIGDRSLSEITREEIKNLCYRKKESGLSARSVQYIAVTITTIFNHAREDGIVTINPAERHGRFIKAEHRRGNVEFLTSDEAKLLLETARQQYPRYFPLFLTALRTGIRKGEVAALQWGDIDWNGKFIEVRRNAWEGRITTPKNGKSRRVDMSDQLCRVLSEHRRNMSAEALREGRAMPEYVFNSELGPRYSGGRIWEVFARCLKKAGMRHVPFHALRHSFASMLIANGEPLAYVKDQLGHSSIQMTVDIYGHLVPGANRQAVNRLDDPEWSRKEVKSAPQAHPKAVSLSNPL